MNENRIRYISTAPGIADQKHVRALGKAETLFLFLIDFQYDADGWVNYRKPITIGWIQKRFSGTNPRSLRRWIAQLRRGGYIATISTGRGWIVRVLNQKKFPTRQYSLYERKRDK